MLVLTFRALQGEAPQYILEMLTPYSPVRTLRSSDQNLLKVPRIKFKTRGERSFQFVAPSLWNSLPSSLKTAETVDIFKKGLKTLLFRKAFG